MRWTSRKARETLPILGVRLASAQCWNLGAQELLSHPGCSTFLCTTANIADTSCGWQGKDKVLNLCAAVCLDQARAALSTALFWVAASIPHGVLPHLKKEPGNMTEPLNLQSESSMFSYCP